MDLLGFREQLFVGLMVSDLASYPLRRGATESDPFGGGGSVGVRTQVK